jgi:hypothetical protein
MAQIPYFQLLRLQAAVLAAVHLRVVQADQAAAALLHNQAVLAQAVRVIMAVILQLQMMAAAAAVQDQ